MDCQCSRLTPLPTNFQVDHLGRCKICKGWRPHANKWFTLHEVLLHEVPAALRPNDFVLPLSVFENIPVQGNLGDLVPEGRGLRAVRIHRDYIATLVRKVEAELRNHWKVR